MGEQSGIERRLRQTLDLLAAESRENAKLRARVKELETWKSEHHAAWTKASELIGDQYTKLKADADNLVRQGLRYGELLEVDNTDEGEAALNAMREWLKGVPRG